MASVVKCFAIDGIDGYPVDIEIETLEGQPMISIIGLGGSERGIGTCTGGN